MPVLKNWICIDAFGLPEDPKDFNGARLCGNVYEDHRGIFQDGESIYTTPIRTVDIVADGIQVTTRSGTLYELAWADRRIVDENMV